MRFQGDDDEIQPRLQCISAQNRSLFTGSSGHSPYWQSAQLSFEGDSGVSCEFVHNCGRQLGGIADPPICTTEFHIFLYHRVPNDSVTNRAAEKQCSRGECGFGRSLSRHLDCYVLILDHRVTISPVRTLVIGRPNRKKIFFCRSRTCASRLSKFLIESTKLQIVPSPLSRKREAALTPPSSGCRADSGAI